jgi:hypothetical protein
MFVRNFGLSPNYTTIPPRRLYYSYWTNEFIKHSQEEVDDDENG